ncbi:hypothetical protein R3P38DRAFT_2805736 [Favolaschia claudopus]|uniref:SAM domain-containing protein n=1 Tax=Favolaschia claudopus TaxID=2862362 RepID=A0AAV9ZM94_9AGAR
MPKAIQELDRSEGVGARGGIGEGPRFQGKIVWLDSADLPRIEKMSTADFCTKYRLDNDVRERLNDEGISNMISLFYEDEDGLKEMGFNIGSIAEIKAALKRRLADKHPDITVVAPRTTNEWDVRGGVGGAGGHGDIKAGEGGTGKAVSLDPNRLHAEKVTGVIRGGKGGAAGTTGDPSLSAANTHSSSMQIARAGTILDVNLDQVDVIQKGLLVEGGEGGAGGWAPNKGGIGGEGQGPRIPMLHVHLFKVNGGTGGEGGNSVREGGGGGEGGAPEIPDLILSISEETRRKIPWTPLEKLDFDDANLRKMLKDNGFRTVGGLLELQQTDLMSVPGFKRGYPRVLQAELDRFCSKYKQ